MERKCDRPISLKRVYHSFSNLKTPDAIHAATALNSSCTLFLTNDSGFRNVLSLPVVILSEVLAS
ncbi:MAG: PIN domain-containing protein [Cyanobacteriota bacterium]